MGGLSDAYYREEAAQPSAPSDELPQYTPAAAGLRAGMQGFAGNMAALYGTGQQALGFNGDEALAYAQKKQQMSAEASSSIPTWDKVHSLRDFGDFVAGNAMQGLPYIVPAVVAPNVARGFGAGIAARGAAGIAVNVLPMAGGEIQSLNSDPMTAKLPASQKLTTGLGVGTADAAMFHAIPHFAGERAFGTPGYAAKAALNPLRTAGNIAADTAVQSAGMGAASAGTTLLEQGVHSSLNPNRDTSQDSNELYGSAASGAGGMLPFAGAGAVMGHTIGAARAPLVDASGKLPGIAKTVGIYAKDKATQAYDYATGAAKDAATSTPEGLGQKLGEKAGGLKDWVNSKVSGDKADYDAIQQPRDLSMHTDPVKAQAAGDADDARRNVKATRLAQNYKSSDNPEVAAAAQDYLKGKKTGGAWEPLAAVLKTHVGALTEMDKIRAASQGFDDMVAHVGQKAGKVANAAESFGTGVKYGYNDQQGNIVKNNMERTNDPFDALLAEKLFPHMEQNPDTISLASKVKDFAANGYAPVKDGDVTVPPGLAQALGKNAKTNLETASNLMRRQGLLQEGNDRTTDFIKKLSDYDAATTDASSLVKQNLLPTAEDQYGIKKNSDYRTIADHIGTMVSTGKFDEDTLDTLFGPNKDKVVSAIGDRYKDRTEYAAQSDERSPSNSDDPNTDDAAGASRVEELGQMTNGRDPNMVAPKVDWRYYDENKGTPFDRQDLTGRHVAKANKLLDESRDGYSDVRVQNLEEAIREKYAGDPQGRAEALQNMMDNKQSNASHYVMRYERAEDKADPLDVRGSEFNTIDVRSPRNKWAIDTGYGRKFGTADQGTVWFERANDDGSTSPFATTTAKLIAHAGKAKTAGALEGDENGARDSAKMLQAGISSLTNSKHNDGRYALTGRVGFMDKPGGEIKWHGEAYNPEPDSEHDTRPAAERVKTAHEEGYGMRQASGVRALDHSAGIPDDLKLNRDGLTMGEARELTDPKTRRAAQKKVKYDKLTRKEKYKAASGKFDFGDLLNMTLPELEEASLDAWIGIRSALEKGDEKGKDIAEALRRRIERIEDEAHLRNSESDLGAENGIGESVRGAPSEIAENTFDTENAARRAANVQLRESTGNKFDYATAQEANDAAGTKIVPVKRWETFSDYAKRTDAPNNGMTLGETRSDYRANRQMVDRWTIERGDTSFADENGDTKQGTRPNQLRGGITENETELAGRRQEVTSPNTEDGTPRYATKEEAEQAAQDYGVGDKAVPDEAGWKLINDADNIEKKMSGQVSETAHMAVAGLEAEDRTPRITDENGDSIQPKATDAALAAAKTANAARDWAVSALRDKGVTALTGMINGGEAFKDPTRRQNLWRALDHIITADSGDTAFKGMKPDEASKLKLRAERTMTALDPEYEAKAPAGKAAREFAAREDKRPDQRTLNDFRAFTAADLKNAHVGEHVWTMTKAANDVLASLTHPLGVSAKTKAEAGAWATKMLDGIKNLSDNVVGELRGRLQKIEDIVNPDAKKDRGVVYRAGDEKLGAADKVGEIVKRNAEKPTTEKSKQSPAELLSQLRDEVHGLLGDDIPVYLKQPGSIAGSAEWRHDPETGKSLINIALNAHDPLGKAYHESMHEFMNRLMKDNGDAARVLQNLANSEPVYRRMVRDHFADEPEVLKDMENDPAERVAYMFQLWAGGHLELGPQSVTLFQKILGTIRKVFGMMSDNQKAEELMKQFAEGNMSERGAMAKVADSIMARGKTFEKFSKWVAPAFNKGAEYVGFAENQLTGSSNKALDWVGRQFNNKVGAQGEDQGVLSAIQQQHAIFDNKFAAALRGGTAEDVKVALEGLQTKTWHKDPIGLKMQQGIAKVFEEAYAYGAEAKLMHVDQKTGKWVPMGKQDDYRLPVSWDASKLVEHGEEFIKELLEHHEVELQKIAQESNDEVAKGEHGGEFTASWNKLHNPDGKPITEEDVARAIHSRMIRTNGQVDIKESQNELGFTPHMKSINNRSLHWIDQTKFAKYQEKDMAKILTTYVGQITHRAEYSRRFGADGSILQAKMQQAWHHEIDGIMKEKYKVDGAFDKAAGAASAVKALHGETDTATELGRLAGGDKELGAKIQADAMKKLAPAQRAIMAMEGTLGHDISPLARKANAYNIVYQNLRLLGYPLFSSFIDPLGIMVNGGEMKDAYATLKRGLGDVFKEWGHLTGLRDPKPEDRDEATRVAEMIGTIDSGMFMSTLGNTYGSQFLGKTARGINDKFFRWNGMEPFTRAMRIGATQAAISFFKRHMESPNEHTERYFKEFNFDKSQAKIVDGRLDVENPNPCLTPYKKH